METTLLEIEQCERKSPHIGFGYKVSLDGKEVRGLQNLTLTFDGKSDTAIATMTYLVAAQSTMLWIPQSHKGNQTETETFETKIDTIKVGRLEIKARNEMLCYGGFGNVCQRFHVLLDGTNIKSVKSLTLRIAYDEAVSAAMEFYL
jgi:hypothetical protein